MLLWQARPCSTHLQVLLRCSISNSPSSCAKQDKTHLGSAETFFVQALRNCIKPLFHRKPDLNCTNHQVICKMQLLMPKNLQPFGLLSDKSLTDGSILLDLWGCCRLATVQGQARCWPELLSFCPRTRRSPGFSTAWPTTNLEVTVLNSFLPLSHFSSHPA